MTESLDQEQLFALLGRLVAQNYALQLQIAALQEPKTEPDPKPAEGGDESGIPEHFR